MIFRRSVSAIALCFAAACSQGSNIASPGPSAPGTPPGAGGGGGGGGGGTASCPAGFTEGAAVGGLTTCNLAGTYLSDLTLPFVSGIAYAIDGRVDIGVDVGADGTNPNGTAATLTIAPGVTVFGRTGADYIVVNRGSQIDADGNAANPIVMTSANDLVRRADSDPSNDFGGDNIGEWGGLVILGQAPINRCRNAATPATVDCDNVVEGVSNPDAVYGGADPTDNSGTLRYVSLRFSGFAIGTGNELNGITLAGVGSGTTVDYVQVHNSSDDGIEFFGGTVNAKHLVLTGADDDSLDTDNGYNGALQYVVVKQRAAGGDNMVEASSVAGISPASDAKVSNFTFLGDAGGNALRLNTGTVGTYVNGVVKEVTECFRWESSAGNGVAGYQAGVDPAFNSVLFDCAAGVETANSDAGAAPAAIAAGTNNSTATASTLAASFFPGPNEAAVTPFDATTLSASFDAPAYIGAFGPAETETQNWATGWSFGLFPDPTCPAGTADSGLEINDQTVCRISGVITDAVRLTRGNVYEVVGRLDVGVDIGADGAAAGGDPASLTIESGVTVFGGSGADYIVVNRGSQIFSNGTRENPVVLTSEADVTGTQPNPENAIGEWGGLVILGRAPINRCRNAATPATVDCDNVVEGVTNPDAVYGGAVPTDNSGSLSYTVVKHSGFEVTTGNELNGITLAGVGTGTTVDYVQVHNSSDDGIEFFGGGVNATHLVLTGADDDSLDTDNGYNGSLQFVIVKQRAAGGDNMVEASSVAGISPPSNAKVSNFTFLGEAGGNAFRLNTGTVGTYVNGVVKEVTECFRWESSAGNGVAGYQAGVDPAFNSVLFDCAAGVETANSDAGAAPAAIAAGTNNSTATASTLINSFINGAAESAVTAFDVTGLSADLEPVDYIGAVENASDTWWQGWSCGLEASDPC
jgi:trimeric autotransporter adhesin